MTDLSANHQHPINEQPVKQVYKISIAGIIVNLGLAAIKFTAGTLGASQAVIADAVHSLSDLSTDIAVIVGVRFWSAPPDHHHPYGHQRIETIIAAGIGLILATVALGLVANALQSFRLPRETQTGWIALAGPICSIVFKEILFRWTRRVGERIRSSAVIANAWHHRSDVLSSVPALLAVSAAAFNEDWWFVDPIGAWLIALFILKVAWDIIRPSLSELTDQGAPEKDLQRMQELAFRVEGVREVHALRTRRLGNGLTIDLHVLVDPEMSVRDGHTIAEKVKTELLEKGPDVVDAVVHLEPWEPA
jgi:cation diffusion facilitator family transporter